MSATKEITDLAIQIKGEIVSSNFEDFKAGALAKISEMDYELLTEDDFVKAKQDIKELAVTGKALKGAKVEMLKQLDDVYALLGGVDEIIAAADECRLSKSREVKKRDAEIKNKIIADALATIDHPKRDQFRNQVITGAKGKRSFETMAKGAQKIAQTVNEGIIASRSLLEEFENAHGKVLIPDRSDLELETVEMVGEKLHARLEKKRDEEEKERLRQEVEKAKTIEETPPAEMPAPPKIDSIPVGSAAKQATETPEEEMVRSIAELEAAFAPIKRLRADLKHDENIRRWNTFAEELTPAYLKLKNN